MNVARRKIFRAGKYVVVGFAIYIVSWIASVTEWSSSATSWSDRRHGREAHALQETSMSTMKTIVAYSEGKQAEMERPEPVSCDDLPRFPEVPHSNRTWSYTVVDGVAGAEADAGAGAGAGGDWQIVPGTDVSLFAAYYDPRPTHPHVRILATYRGRKWGDRPQLYCQTRPRNPTQMNVEVVAAKVLEIWRNEWDASSDSIETPLLLSCSLTEKLAEVSVVSVVQQPCYDPSNAFVLNPLEHNGEYLRNFTVCVKDMKFGDNKAHSLIEWIEVNKILGAEMIDIYIDEVSEELRHVLEHYRREGTVRLLRVPIKQGERSLWQRRRDHIISYNDCLYRNIRESKFIVPIDIDEVVLPKVAENWEDLILRLEALDWDPALHSAIMVKNVFFFEFMQNLGGPQFEIRNTSTSRLYTKRDDVRLGVNNSLDLENTHTLGEDIYNSTRKSVIDDKELQLERYREMYKSRCQRDMPVSTVLSHRVRSSLVSPVGEFSKSIMLTRRVLTAFNHYPLDSVGAAVFGGWPAPFREVQMNHYKAECNSSLVSECGVYSRERRTDRAAQRLRTALVRALAASPCLNTTAADVTINI